MLSFNSVLNAVLTIFCVVLSNKVINCDLASDVLPIKSNEFSSDGIPRLHSKLITDATAWFPNQSPLAGYELFIRRYNNTAKATLFNSEHMADHLVIHNGSDDKDRQLVLLTGQTETVPYKNVTTYLVMRQTKDQSNRYTSHLAYVRNFGSETSVEWDIYSFHFHNPNGSFISAFYPTRWGPDTVTPGKGPQRVKRKGTDCGPLTFFACLRKEVRTKRGRRAAGGGKPHWSWHSTEAPITNLEGVNTGDSSETGTTEYPMYGGGGTGLDENGFTTLAPWSTFRRNIETTELPNPFGSGGATATSSPSGPTKMCFSLFNCNDRPKPKPTGNKACAFGYRCKNNFIDRYAVATSTSTERPNFPQVIDDSEGKKKKKHKKKTKEECEAEEGAKGDAVSEGGQQGRSAASPQYVFHINNIVCKGGLKCDVKKEGSKWGGSTHDEDPCAQYKKDGVASNATTAGEADMGIQEGNSPLGVKMEKTATTPPQTLTSLVSGSSSGPTLKPGAFQIWAAEPREAGVPNQGYGKAGFDHDKAAEAGRTYELAKGQNQPSNHTVVHGRIMEAVTSTTVIPETTKSSTKSKPRGKKWGWNGRGRREIRDTRGAGEGTLTNSINPDLKRNANRLELLEFSYTIGQNERSFKESEQEENSHRLGLEESTRRNKHFKRSRGRSQLKRTSVDDLLEIESAVALKEKEVEETQVLDPLIKYSATFIGIGDCPYKKVNDTWRPNDPTDLVDFYLQVFKVQCLPHFKTETKRLFISKLLTAGDEPFRIALRTSNSLFRSKTLGEFDWDDYVSSIFLATFSNIYADQRSSQLLTPGRSEVTSPMGQIISMTSQTFSLFTLQILHIIKSSEQHHGIKLANALLIALQGQRSDLVTKQDLLEKCEIDCDVEKTFNFNDQLQVNSLMRFIVDHFAEIVVGGDLNEQFHNFYIQYHSVNMEHVKNKIPFVF